MIKICLDVRFSINPSKLVQPTSCLEFISIILDTEKMEMRISDQRMGDILEEVAIWQYKNKVTKCELSLVRKLIFICYVIRPGRIYVQ